MKYRIPLILICLMLFGCKEKVSSTKSLIHLVPENAPVVLKINDLPAFLNGLASDSFITEFGKTPLIKMAFEKTRYLDFLDPKSKSILAFVEAEKGIFESVYIAEGAPDLVVFDSLSKLNMEQFDFKGISLEKFQIEQNSFYHSTIGNKFVIASSPAILEQLIERLKNNMAPEALQKLYVISKGYKTATLFVDVKKINPLFQTVLKKDSKINISNFSDWMSLDFNSKPSQLNLTGVSVTNDSVWNYIDLFANTKPLAHISPSLAPKEIDVLVSYTFDDYTKFAANQKAFLIENLAVNPLFESVEEVGIISNNDEKAVVLNTHGPETLTEHLEQSKIATIDYQGNQIIRLKNSKFIEEGFKPLVQNFNSKFCTFINDAFVFSENEEFLEYIIRNQKNGSTYDKGTTFQGLGKFLAEESNLLVISNSTSLKGVLRQDLIQSFSKELDASLKSQFDMAAQVTADKNFYHTNIIIKKNEKTAGNKGITEFFKTKIDTAIATSPQFVTNHLTKKKEVLVQDHKNVLYLISSDGKIVWKKQLEGPVNGKVQQVDIFKNGRLQLAFTTNNQFMVLDRNGKEVRRFTKTFEGGGLNPIAVFDYDNKKNYRFVITQGKKTFMYNSKAEIVGGFKYTNAEDIIVDAPKHIRIGIKDFLVFKLKNGSLKLLNRVGDVRTKVSEKIDFSDNAVYLNKDKFTLTDKKGTLYQIDQIGKITKTNFNLSNDHGMFATANTLVLMNDNILTIRGKKVELELGVYTPPQIFYLNNKIYISVTDLQSQKVYLFDSQAKPIPNFPVFGNSVIDLADLDNDNILEMTVLGQYDEIITYKLN